MRKRKLKQWNKILKDKNPLNVVFLYLNEWGGFKFVIDDDLLPTIGEEATKKLLEVYAEGFEKSIKEAFKPFDEIIKFQISATGTKKTIKFQVCECGDNYYAPIYWDDKKQKMVCQTCMGYPDDREHYKKQREENAGE